MISARRLVILLVACFPGALVLSVSTQGQNGMPTPMEEINAMPTPIVASRERYVTRQELEKNHPEFMARLKKQIENYKGLNPDSEKVTYRDDIGYIFRYEILDASQEEVNANPYLRSFFVSWTKDFK